MVLYCDKYTWLTPFQGRIQDFSGGGAQKSV